MRRQGTGKKLPDHIKTLPAKKKPRVKITSGGLKAVKAVAKKYASKKKAAKKTTKKLPPKKSRGNIDSRY